MHKLHQDGRVMQSQRVHSGDAPCSPAMTPTRQVSESEVSTPAADRYARSPRLLRNTAGSTPVCGSIAIDAMHPVAGHSPPREDHVLYKHQPKEVCCQQNAQVTCRQHDDCCSKHPGLPGAAQGPSKGQEGRRDRAQILPLHDQEVYCPACCRDRRRDRAP